jgi:hypothetical protein
LQLEVVDWQAGGEALQLYFVVQFTFERSRRQFVSKKARGSFPLAPGNISTGAAVSVTG